MGYGSDETRRNIVKSLRMQPDDLEAHVEKLFKKYALAKDALCRYESVGVEDADIVFVAFGTVSRIAREAIELLGEQGIKAGLIRPISLWPFPYQAFDAIGVKQR